MFLLLHFFILLSVVHFFPDHKRISAQFGRKIYGVHGVTFKHAYTLVELVIQHPIHLNCGSSSFFSLLFLFSFCFRFEYFLSFLSVCFECRRFDKSKTATTIAENSTHFDKLSKDNKRIKARDFFDCLFVVICFCWFSAVFCLYSFSPVCILFRSFTHTRAFNHTERLSLHESKIPHEMLMLRMIMLAMEAHTMLLLYEM